MHVFRAFLAFLVFLSPLGRCPQQEKPNLLETKDLWESPQCVERGMKTV